ncbi:hypothetical protein [Psychrobacter pacificensis]|uniref:hypothetical protein n=1 Tax=Psychrobacter pacificensis TaxID=112002 RepID=UPI003C6DD484
MRFTLSTNLFIGFLASYVVCVMTIVCFLVIVLTIAVVLTVITIAIVRTSVFLLTLVLLLLALRVRRFLISAAIGMVSRLVSRFFSLTRL